MKTKTQKASVAEKIMKVINKQPMTADGIRKQLKDQFGYSIKPEDIRVNLLYLLRREKIKRTKEDKIYKYHV
jgi:predicted transcriptional regulator